MPMLELFKSTRRWLLVAAVLVSACHVVPVDPGSHEQLLTVLYTNDEHGWMEGVTPEQGAANMLGLWREEEGYTPDGPFLVLSGGDNWTGPAISTVVAGQSMLQVMNQMRYAASAVGNHEFDFGLEVLKQRIAEAEFPYLSANTAWRQSNEQPFDLGIKPYIITTVHGIRVGIIGLTTTSTPRTTNPVNVAELEFADYEQTLRSTVPRLRAAGVDMVIVLAHVCLAPIRQLAQSLQELDIQMIGGGHCNELVAQQLNDTVVLVGGSHLASYASARFSVNLQTRHVSTVDYAVHDNVGGQADPDVAQLVKLWQQRSAAAMSAVIGFSQAAVDRRDQQMERRIIESWLLADSTADVAITNGGGIRAGLPAGEISLGTVVGMLPFENTIIATHLTGAALKQVLAQGARPLVAGLYQEGDDYVEAATGNPLMAARVYRVLVNSFMYAGGDGYEGIAVHDPDGFDTGINYRQPFADWIAAQRSTATNPLQF